MNEISRTFKPCLQLASAAKRWQIDQLAPAGGRPVSVAAVVGVYSKSDRCLQRLRCGDVLAAAEKTTAEMRRREGSTAVQMRPRSLGRRGFQGIDGGGA
jgi:hypothetical protein